MNGGNEYVPADQAIELLGEKPEKFYYHSGRGEIRTETPAQPGKGKKNNRYLVSDILALRRKLIAQRQKKRPEPVIDWMYSRDLAAGVKLAQALYDDSVDLAEMAVYQSWRKNNEHLTLAAFSPDRSEAYASIQVVPLPEQVILDVLSGRRSENSILPDEIRSYNEPGEYTLLGTSAIVLKDRPELLLKLLRRYMEYWVDMYPDRYISRIYAQAVSDSGDKLTSSLFMAPRYDLAGPYPSYMLDLARPGRSKLIGWFQSKLRTKAIEKGIEFPPEELQHPYAPSILPVQAPVQVTTAQATHAPPRHHTMPSELPPGTITLNELATELGVNRSTLYEQVRDNHLDHISIPLSELGKPGAGQERFFTPAQAQAVRDWRTTRPKRKREGGDD